MDDRERPARYLSPLLIALALNACGPTPDQGSPDPPLQVPAGSGGVVSSALFDEVGPESGFDFVHFSGMSGEYYFSEMVGPGAAFFDADGDGDLDIYIVQGHMLGGKPIDQATSPPQHPLPLSDRLYRNDLSDGVLSFTDITEASGLGELTVASPDGGRGYGMGVATGDFDNDGHVDLYVTALGGNQLLHNLGPGADGTVTFEDITERAGAGDARWGVSAAVLDVDRDGWLDLFVGNYVDYSVATHKRCRAATGADDYCGPHTYPNQGDRLLRNRGDGTFEDVTKRSGLDRAFGGALGVVAADLDLDGWMDLYVANDGTANQMWMNRGGDGGLAFVDESLISGTALNLEGNPEAGMGVDAADFDNDGDEDLFLAHLTQETNTLYRNSGGGQFHDATVATGLAAPSWEATGFGTAFFDIDNDGWLDILVLNGAVKVIEALARAGDPHPIHQPNQLFRNLGNGRFEEVTARAGEAFARSEVSRGAAFGDIDNDGDTDLLVGNNHGPARLLLNTTGQDTPSLGLRLLLGNGRDALGAWVEVLGADGAPRLWRRVSTGGSYASANDPRILAGLGEDPAVTGVRVRWPDGAWERFEVDAAAIQGGGYVTLRQGEGESP